MSSSLLFKRFCSQLYAIEFVVRDLETRGDDELSDEMATALMQL